MNQQEQHNPPHIVHNLKNIVLIALFVVLAITVVGLGFKVSHTTESKTTKLGFEDIGEFATQSAYCTEVSATANARSNAETMLTTFFSSAYDMDQYTIEFQDA